MDRQPTDPDAGGAIRDSAESSEEEGNFDNKLTCRCVRMTNDEEEKALAMLSGSEKMFGLMICPRVAGVSACCVSVGVS